MKPYYIYGDEFGHGNEAVPVRAYEKVYREILEQEEQMGIQFDYIFLSTGTGMTQAGLLSGKLVSIGKGYGKKSSIIDKAIYDMMVLNGIPLDPTYTGKAFLGMRDYIIKNNISNKNVLFIHTGGTPLFFDNLRNVK